MASRPEAPDFSGWPAGALRRYLQERGISSHGVVEGGELLALAEAAAAGAPPQAHQPPAAAASARPAAQDPGSFADVLVQSLIQSTENPRLVAALESMRADPAMRAQLDGMGQGLTGQQLAGDTAPVEIMPGVFAYLPAISTGRVHEAMVQVVALHPTAAAEMGIGAAPGGGGSSGSGVAGNASAGHASPAGAVPPAAPSKHCAVCGKAAEPGSKLKRCGGCRKVLYCGVECQGRHWRSGHSEECSRLRQDGS